MSTIFKREKKHHSFIVVLYHNFLITKARSSGHKLLVNTQVQLLVSQVRYHGFKSLTKYKEHTGALQLNSSNGNIDAQISVVGKNLSNVGVKNHAVGIQYSGIDTVVYGAGLSLPSEPSPVAI